MSEYDVEDWGSGGSNSGGGWDDPDGGGSEGAIEVENTFYEAEGIYRDNPEEALQKFESVVTMEKDRNEFNFSFNAQKFIVILSLQLERYDQMLEAQQKLNDITGQASRNEVSEAINRILDLVESQLRPRDQQKSIEMYTKILSTLRTYNERLWLNISLRLCRLYQDAKNLSEVNERLVQLKQACLDQEKGGQSANLDLNLAENYDRSKGSMLLEVFAFEIQLSIENQDQRRMSQIFRLSQHFASTIEDPRVLGVLNECGGKVFMAEKKWKQALEQFQTSFRSLVEVGSDRAQVVLKYVILASLLSKAEFDVLNTQEAAIYAQDKEIQAMTNLKRGFEKGDIQMIQSIVNDRSVNLLADNVIATYLEDLLRSVRLNAVADICKPYKTVRLDFLARRMNVNVEEVRGLLSELILDERLEAQIDQLNGLLELRSAEQQTAQKHRAMNDWGSKILERHSQLVSQVQVAQGLEDEMMGF